MARAHEASSPRRSVAIFDADAPTALAFARSVGAHDVPVDVYAPQRITVTGSSRFTRASYRCPPLEQTDAFLAWLRQRLADGAIDLIAPTSDLVLYYLACVFDALSPEMQAVLGSADSILDMVFKDRFYRRCIATNQATPKTYVPTSLDEAVALAPSLSWPVILKPRSHVGVGSTRGVVVHDESELRAHFAPAPITRDAESIFASYPDLRWPMIQEYIPRALENLYSVSGVVAPNGDVVAVSASRKIEQWPRDLGIGMLFAPCLDEAPIAAGLAFLRAVGQRGIFELELIYDETTGRYSAIDLNPRAFGQITLDIARGNDLPWLWYRLACGEDVALPSARRDDIRWIHALPFHFGSLIDIAMGPHRASRFASYREAVREPHVDVVHAANDWMPSLTFTAKMLRHPVSLARPFIREHLPKALRR